jgi:hypothetical protein
MKLRLHLTTSQKDDYKIIAGIDPGRLAVAADALKTQERRMLRPAEIRAALSPPLDVHEARAVVQQVVALLTLKRRRRLLDPEALTQAVTEALRSTPAKWNAEDLERWDTVRPAFERIVSAEPVMVVAKALHLSFDYANWLEGARILTDIRPVFDDTHREILGAIISHVLRLDFGSDDGSHTVSVAMTEEDVEMLRQACEESLKKSREAKQLATDRLDISAFIAGEENYDLD